MIRNSDKENDKKDEISLTEKLLKTRTLTLFDTVNAKVAKEVIQGLFLLEADDAKTPINLFINSPGGEVSSGFAIYDAINFIKPTVRTIASGLCASAGVLIFIAAKKENRLSLPNSKFLLHQPSIGSVGGSTTDIEIIAKDIINTKAKLNELLSKATGQSINRIQEDTDRDYWMSASQAQEYGLVSRVIDSRDELR